MAVKFANQFALRCPKCKRSDRIDISALVSVRLTRDGTDADEASNGDHEWDGASGADCAACDFSGKVADFGTCQCQNCLKVWNLGELKEIRDYHERVVEGEHVPSGECPECGSLCHGIEDSEDVMEEYTGEEEDSDDEDSDEPDEDAITTKDHINFYQYGKKVFEYDADEQILHIMGEQRQMNPPTVEDAIRAYMNHAQFWPDAWFVSDHGNAHRIDLTPPEGWLFPAQPDDDVNDGGVEEVSRKEDL